MTTFTDIFTGSPVQPSDVGYATYTLAADKTLAWPSTANTSDVVARIMTIVCNGAYSLTMPAANEAATGQDALITNTGSTTLTVKDSSGATIATVIAGATKYIYLTDNTTTAGIWAAVAFGVGTSNVDASALAGYGLLAISTTLNQSCPVTTLNTATLLTVSDRARLNVDTVGIVLTLPSAATMGNNYFTFIRNGSSGSTVVTPSGGDLIDGSATATLNPAESVMVVSSGTAWYTVGWGRSVTFNYSQLTKNVAGGTDVTLTVAEAGNKILKFTGLLTANINVIVPTTTTIWYIDNATTGSFTLTVKTSAGSGVATAGGTHYILYGDGTNVVNAVTVTGAFSSFAAGSAASPSITFAADTDSGLYNTAANQVGIAVGGTQVANFTSAGLAVTGAVSMTSPLPVASGGTALASYTVGDILYASGTTTLAKLADVATGNALISGGVGVAPSYGKIALTTAVSGILPEANGGTNNAFFSVAGPATSVKTYTFPNATCTILSTNGGTFTGDITLASGAAIETSISTVASATTPDIWTSTSNVINYTGTITATGFAAAPQAGVHRTLILAGAASFTAGANMLIDGVVSFSGAAGDEVEVFAVTTTQFRLRPKLASGAAIISSYGRRLNQIVTSQVGTVATGTTVIPADNTIPQITEGDQYLSLAITPANASSTLEIEVVCFATNNTSATIQTALFQDATAGALAAVITNLSAVSAIAEHSLTHIMTAGTTSATTFKVRIGGNAAGTTTFNGSAGVQYMGGVMASRITIKEYLP